MTQFIVGTAAIDMPNLSLGSLMDAPATTRTSTIAIFDHGDGEIVTLSGFGVTYNSQGEPVSGTITSLQDNFNNVSQLNISGFSISAVLFNQLANADDTVGFFGNILAGDDDFQGGSLNDVLQGYPGNDLMQGFAGHDNLFGGSGSDTLVGGDGNDHLYGQSANGGSDGRDSLSGGNGSDYLQGNADNDTLNGGDGSDRIQGGASDDQIIGDNGNDTVNGNLGNDAIDGGADDDSLRGGQGNDSIAGNSGNDVLSGDLGTDTLSGGSGIDLFQFSGAGSPSTAPDRITDFADGTDRIAIGQLPTTVLTGASQFSLSDAASLAQQLFNGSAGTSEVAAIAVGSDTYVFYSSNGGATIDSAIQLVGLNPSIVTATDFG